MGRACPLKCGCPYAHAEAVLLKAALWAVYCALEFVMSRRVNTEIQDFHLSGELYGLLMGYYMEKFTVVILSCEKSRPLCPLSHCFRVSYSC